MNDSILPFTRLDKLRSVLETDNRLMALLSRFNIKLGFGDASVETVCRENGVDTDTFLAVANFRASRRWEEFPIDADQLTRYLRRSHVRFLDYTLPGIKRALIDGIHEGATPEVAMVILRFFEEYVEEVGRHMDYEDSVVFAYVGALIEGTITDSFRISEFSDRHEHMAGKLDDLKNLFIYRFAEAGNERLTDALTRLMECGVELREHCEMENRMLFPAVKELERRLRDNMADADVTDDAAADADTGLLTEREKEVLREITNGLSTKEIADRLCLSFHTVTTYRKNLAEKLNIHSAAGMAVYAILHHLVDPDEIRLH